MGRKLFCEINSTTYTISVKKERMIRRIKDAFSTVKIAKSHSDTELPNIVKSHSSLLLRKLYGVDMQLQKNKITNIELACKKINGIIIMLNLSFLIIFIQNLKKYWMIMGYWKMKYVKMN